MAHARANIVGAATLLVFVACASYLTVDFRRGSGFFPFVVLGLLGITGAIWLVRSALLLRAEARGGAPDVAWRLDFASLGGYAVLAITGVYGAVVVTTGYVYPSIVYILLVALILGGRRYLLIALLAGGFPFAV
jgi:hypothetical protein